MVKFGGMVTALGNHVSLSSQRELCLSLPWLPKAVTMPPSQGGKKRSAQALKTLLKTLRSIWGKHFRELYGIKVNPWREIPLPLVEKKIVRIPSEDTVNEFFKWLKEQYPFFWTIRRFCEVKALIGCRTMDLCVVKSSQVKNGRLTLEASQTKHRTERSILLPPDLFAALDANKGPEYLWERYADETVRYSKKPGKVSMDFTPTALYAGIRRIFDLFNDGRENRILPHDLRRRAITLTTKATKSLEETAHAIGVTPETARRHYLDMERAFQADETLTAMADILRPKTA